MTMRKMIIIEGEYTEEDPVAKHLRDMENVELDNELGKDLTTIEKARQWLLHPVNFSQVGDIDIMKWDGLVPRISKRHAFRLLREPWDTGLFEVAVRHQHHLRNKARRGESIIEQVFEISED